MCQPPGWHPGIKEQSHDEGIYVSSVFTCFVPVPVCTCSMTIPDNRMGQVAFPQVDQPPLPNLTANWLLGIEAW